MTIYVHHALMPKWITFAVAASLTTPLASTAPAAPPQAAATTTPAPPVHSAAVASPRTDPNSRLAHQQLVAKAKASGIDLYFLGDSITRRWGCTDPQYAALLENWKANFFG